MKCERCEAESLATMMSKFNTETICIDCKDREREHPQYAEADRAEMVAVRSGNMNFPGIGCPPSLYPQRQTEVDR